MNENLSRARRYHEKIRKILLIDWDPIGIGEVAEAQSEYDSYISEIYKMLITRRPEHELFDFLWFIETHHMGLAGNRRRTEAVATALMKLPSQLAQADRS